MIVHKILRADEWAAFTAAGSFVGSPDDLRDGFIHMSTAEQLDGTLAKHFAGETGLVRLDIDTDTLGDGLRWDAARGGALFPHLYRPLDRAEVVTVTHIG